MTLKERMFYLIEKEGINPNQFYTKSGLGNGYLDKVGDSFRKPTIEKIKKNFPHWNMDWILFEKGEPIINSIKNTEILEAIPLNQNYIINVPLVNQYAQAGYLCGFQDAAYIATLPTIPFIIDHEAKGNYVAFEVRGDSMNDGTEESYLEGDKLLCREIAPYHGLSTRINANLLITKRLAFLFYSCCTTIAQLGSRIWKILIVLLYFFKYKIDIKSYFSYYEYLTFYHLYIIAVDCFKGVGIY